jgi:uncharacterized protein YPO0396
MSAEETLDLRAVSRKPGVAGAARISDVATVSAASTLTAAPAATPPPEATQMSPVTAVAPVQPSPARDGIRLQRVELLNWGTFHDRVAVLNVQGGNCLLTGQVGVGKSTLVDAISILLNPPSQVTFNQAAGATRRERTLTSYVLGAHRNVSDDVTGLARPDYLRRAAGTQSVILAVFSDAAGRTVTAGIMLRFQNEATTPRQQYLTADRQLSIAGDFTGHPDARTLRAALKASGVEIYDHYHQYAKALARKLRLSRVALGLFNQTVSMKSVGNLTEFVRTHMLEAPDVAAAVDKMLAHYADLTRAHDLVVDARRQHEALNKVADESKRLDAAEGRIVAVQDASRGVPALIDAHRRDLLTAAIAADSVTLPTLESELREADAQVAALRRQQTDLKVRLLSGGGTDLALAERDLDDANARLEQTVMDRRELERLAEAARVPPPGDGVDFAHYLASLHTAATRLAAERSDHQQALGHAVAKVTEARDGLRTHDQETAAAATRSSNIPIRLASLRDRISDELALPVGTLVFAGELLTVVAEHAIWRGATERLVRGFALSLLVPAAHHAAVTAWVDRQHLGQRLVTYRVGDVVSRHAGAAAGTVASKLVVKPGQHASTWVAAEIARRFDHQCVTDAADLSRHDRALSRAGQVKDNNRQEKDDRSRVDERLAWVLGWDTRDRRAALEAARPRLLAAVTCAEEDLARVTSSGDDLLGRDRALATLAAQFTDGARVDVPAALAAQRVAADHVEALRSDPRISALNERLAALDHLLHRLTEQVHGLVGQIATTQAALRGNRSALEALDVAELDLSPQAQRLLDRARKEGGAAPVTLAGIDRWERAVRDKVDDYATSARLHRSGVEQALIGAMTAYGAVWNARVVDIDTSNVAGRVDLLAIRDRLIADDLPRFEKDFREKLQSNAINEIAMFSRKLDSDTGDIAERIATINAALADIDYHPGTRIQLTVEPTKDQQVRDFRAELKAITTGMVGAGDGSYNESKFLAVRELLDRLRGREGHVEEDQRWMRRVTDVRNWHTFAATERSRDEDTLVEHYSDSDGKSGGQKEKLAYTILAASLAYQYGLAEGDTRGFRFVMIDEAFGRGSEESSKYGLDLFRRLGLQLLVVTPLQKISTIEPYVQAVGYIGKTGTRSRLRSMTVEEFREMRRQRLTGLPYGLPSAGVP